MSPKGTVYSGENRRRLLPLALCSALRALIGDEPMDPSARRAELRSLLYRLQRLYGIDSDVNASELAQHVAGEEGEAHVDAP